MMNNHNILKTFIDVESMHHRDGFKFKEELAEMCTEQLLPALNKLFDELSPVTQNIIIEKLEIDAGELAAKNWKEVLIEAVLREVKYKFLKYQKQGMQSQKFATDSDSEDVITRKEENKYSPLQGLVHFLRTGRMPWYAAQVNPQEGMLYILKHEPDNFKSILRETVLREPVILKRLIHQFPDEILRQLLNTTHVQEQKLLELSERWDTLFELSEIHAQERKEKIYTAGFKTVLFQRDKIQTEKLQTFSEVIIKNLNSEEKMKILSQEKLILQTDKTLKPQLLEIKKSVVTEEEKPARLDEVNTQSVLDENNKTQKNKKTLPQVDADGYYINNTGIVLLNPFLLPLFANLGYIQNKNWLSEEAQHRAIALLQYMINSTDIFSEHELLLNKIICGYELDKTLPVDLLLSEFEKQEAKDVLLSVINHWAALKHTSIEGLQNTFLQREGKLTFQNNEWLLQAEQKTVDILLNKMPWGYSYIKLPCMEFVLRTEWA